MNVTIFVIPELRMRWAISGIQDQFNSFLLLGPGSEAGATLLFFTFFDPIDPRRLPKSRRSEDWTASVRHDETDQTMVRSSDRTRRVAETTGKQMTRLKNKRSFEEW